MDIGLHFAATPASLVAYCDSDFAEDSNTRLSVSGYVFQAGTNMISWKSGQQKTVATSTCEAEYMALFHASQEALFLGPFVAELLGTSPSPVTIYVDNNGAIALAKNPVWHKRCKHIDIKYHSVREQVRSKTIIVERIDSADNLADVFTKSVTRSVMNTLKPWIISDLSKFSCCQPRNIPEIKGEC